MYWSIGSPPVSFLGTSTPQGAHDFESGIAVDDLAFDNSVPGTLHVEWSINLNPNTPTRFAVEPIAMWGHFVVMRSTFALSSGSSALCSCGASLCLILLSVVVIVVALGRRQTQVLRSPSC